MKVLIASKGEKIAAIIVTASVILAMAICMGINFMISRSLTWSLYPVYSLALGWFITMPAILLREKKLIGAFVAGAIGVIPYLWGIESLTPAKNWVIPLAMPLTVLAIIVTIAIVLVYIRLNTGITAKIFLTLMLVSLGYLGVDYIVGSFVGSGSNAVNIVISMSLFFVSLLGFITMYLIHKIAKTSSR